MKFKTKLPKQLVHSGPLACVSWANNDEAHSIGDDHQLYKWTIAGSTAPLEPTATAKLPDDFVPTDLHWLTPSSARLAHAALASTKSVVSGGGGGASTGIIGTSSSSSSGASAVNDALLITSTDGRFVILNRSSRVERNVSAHSGAIWRGRWSPDGAGLLTAGEDGAIKVWSRSGMLRSTVVQPQPTAAAATDQQVATSAVAIRCACWSPASDAIAFAQGNQVAIRQLMSAAGSGGDSGGGGRATKWRAHDGLVLCVDWSPDRQHVATGGEDGRYKVWTVNGVAVFASYADDYAVTSVAFAAVQEMLLLAVGGFNSLRLCDANGWSLGHTKFAAPALGSLLSIAWSPDGTQICAGTAVGHLLHAHLIEQRQQWRQLSATTTGRRTIRLRDIAAKTEDTLDFPDRIVAWRLGYEHLVVAAAGGQVHVYQQKYINTPLAVVEGRAGVRHVELARRWFLLVDPHGMWVYSYAGRLVAAPRWPGLAAQAAQLTGEAVALGERLLAVRDEADQTLIRVFDLQPAGANRPTPDAVLLRNRYPVTQVTASRAGHADHQFVVWIDSNRDAYCATNLCGGADGGSSDSSGHDTHYDDRLTDLYKLGSQVLRCLWSADSNQLVALHDGGTYSVWYAPGEACADPTLLALTTGTAETAEFGRGAVQLQRFEGAVVRFGCQGCTYAVQMNVWCDAVQRLLADDRWPQALKVCRRSQSTTVWATLAAIASRRNQLDICEEAFSAVLQVDKVDYLNHVKVLTNTSASTIQTAEAAIMAGRRSEAETILMHSAPTDAAIQMCVRLHNWTTALDLAKRSSAADDLKNDRVESVLRQRREYLRALARDEYLPGFMQATTATKA